MGCSLFVVNAPGHPSLQDSAGMMVTVSRCLQERRRVKKEAEQEQQDKQDEELRTQQESERAETARVQTERKSHEATAKLRCAPSPAGVQLCGACDACYSTARHSSLHASLHGVIYGRGVSTATCIHAAMLPCIAVVLTATCMQVPSPISSRASLVGVAASKHCLRLACRSVEEQQQQQPHPSLARPASQAEAASASPPSTAEAELSPPPLSADELVRAM